MSERWSRALEKGGEALQPFAVQTRRQEFLGAQADMNRAHEAALERRRQAFQTSERKAGQGFLTERDAKIRYQQLEDREYEEGRAEARDKAAIEREDEIYQRNRGDFIEDRDRREGREDEALKRQNLNNIHARYGSQLADIDEKIHDVKLSMLDANAEGMATPEAMASFQGQIAALEDEKRNIAQMYMHHRNALGDPTLPSAPAPEPKAGGMLQADAEVGPPKPGAAKPEGPVGTPKRDEDDEPGVVASVERPAYRRRPGARNRRGGAKRGQSVSEGLLPGERGREGARSVAKTKKPRPNTKARQLHRAVGDWFESEAERFSEQVVEGITPPKPVRFNDQG